MYTGVGDRGTTRLGDGAEVPKDHPRVAAYGAGAIIVAGGFDTGTWDVAFARFTAAGALDTSFDGDGIAERLFKTRRDDGFTEDPFIRPECGVQRRIGPRDERIAVETVRIAGTAVPPMILVQSSSGATGHLIGISTTFTTSRPPSKRSSARASAVAPSSE